MNYIGLINKFWLLHEEHSFCTTEIALFFHLLKINNQCSWKESFRRNNSKIEADLRISFNTMKNARHRLSQAGIIKFQSKNGSPDVTYSITLSKFDEVTTKVGDEVDDEVTTKVTTKVTSTKDKLNQTKPNQTKKSKSHSETEVPVIEKIEDLITSSKQPEEGFYKKFVSVWFEFYQKKFSMTATFGALEGEKLKSIHKKIKQKAEEFQMDWNEMNAELALRQFLEVAASDKWYRENFQLSILDTKFDLIIVKALKSNAINQNSDSGILKDW